jgi:hypothetical protein
MLSRKIRMLRASLATGRLRAFGHRSSRRFLPATLLKYFASSHPAESHGTMS